MSNPIITELKKRYTTKHYDASKRIPQEDLAIIYEALRLSPSSINSQPWKFLVIESEEAKQRFHDTFANKFQFNQKHAKTASHTILFAQKTHYTRADYEKVINADIKIGRTKIENKEQAFGAFAFVEMNTDDKGYNAPWTKSQTYIAFGNILNVVARLGIDSTAMEGVDHELISENFPELEGYRCDVALAIGYSDTDNDYNATLPKSRLPLDDILTVL